MRDVAWRTGFTFVVLAMLTLVGPNVSCHLDHRLVEQILGQTPASRIARYLQATARGDRDGALNLWQPAGAPHEDLAARREMVTGEFLARGSALEYRLLDTVWWRTCCEPGIIDDPAVAGGAQVRVAVAGGNKAEEVYVFDLLVPGGYWGDAAGNPIRNWAIVDIYPEGDAPLAWPR